jgi:hypothetical protein
MLFAALAFWLFQQTSLASQSTFLDIDPGARSSGMGSAFTALSDDTNGVFFNPAGLTNMDLNIKEGSASIAFLSQNRFDNFLSIYQQAPPKNYFGFNILQYGVGNIAGTDSNGLSTGNLEDMELAFGVAYAYDFDYHFKAGINASFLYQNLTGVKALGCGGADIGILVVPTVLYDFSLGACIRHLGGFLSWNDGSIQTLTPNLRVGAALKLFHQSLVLAYDADCFLGSDTTVRHHVGGEFWIENIVALRGGVDNSNPTFGASFRYSNYGLDYSYEFQLTDGLGDSQRIGGDLFF